MPELSEEDLKTAIASGRIRAIAPDTNVFVRYGCNLEFRVLTALYQFNGGEIRVLFSDVVRQEMRRHMIEDLAECQRNLKSALKKQAQRLKAIGDPEAYHKALAIDVAPATAVDEQIETFLKKCGAKVVLAEGEALAKEVMRRYFSVASPFEHKANKKSEFPDAFALLSLEAEACATGTQILCVSDDGGWRDFCNASEHLVWISELDKAISYFVTTGSKTANDTLTIWRRGEADDLDRAVFNAFASELEGYDFYPEGNLPTNFEADPLSATILGLNIRDASYPIIIDARDDEITFTTRLDAKISFEAEFRAFAKDEGLIPLGRVTETTTETLPCELVITIARDLIPQPVALSIEVRLPKISVDFGYVNPFRDEDPTHEKY